MGGRTQIWKHKGYTFDLGLSWYWMPDLINNFFKDFGYKQQDLYKLKRLNPPYRVYFNDEFVDLPLGKVEMYTLFEHYEKGAEKKLATFLQNVERVNDIALRSFVPYPYKSFIDCFHLSQMIAGLQILRCYNGLQSVHAFLSKNFHHPKLIKLLSFLIFFLGESTKNIPCVYSMMNHVDINQGTWYPVGGFGSVVKAFVKIAKENGVNIYTNKEVMEIVVEYGKTTGVKTTENKFHSADIVISNADYYHTEQKLLPETHWGYSQHSWDRQKLAPSAFLIHLGLKKKIPGLSHHTLFFTNDWEKNNDALFTKPQWPSHPLYYVSAPTKTDSTLAPLGSEILTLLVPLASGLMDNYQHRERLAKTVLEDLERTIRFPVTRHIAVKRIYALNDFASDYHAYKGNAYGLGHTLTQTAIFRPSFKSKKISNLYFTGQYTIPGIGVPMVIISGKIVATDIAKTYGINE